jgi:hypothetical protein
MKKLLFVTAALCTISTAAVAGETLKLRHVQHAGEFHAVEVSDAKGHTLNVLHAVGVASDPPIPAFCAVVWRRLGGVGPPQ